MSIMPQVDKEFTGALCAPRGFTAAARYSGIKKERNPDLGVIVSNAPCQAAWVSTRNQVVAAPVRVSLEHLTRNPGHMRGIVLNSGNANAVTGAQGMADAKEMCALFSRELERTRLAGDTPGAGIRSEPLHAGNFAVLSTGVIGHPLPMHCIREHAAALCADLSIDGAQMFTRAMMTTDTYPKFGTVRASGWTLGGATKGSGMIHPNMGTMLGVITTDAAIDHPTLQNVLSRCTRRTFNRISVDGDTSTNDMVILLANGQSGIMPNLDVFESALMAMCTHLATEIVRDGEGASKFVTLNVRGCSDETTGEKIAQTIATSSLVKTALYGQDANWGRILAAIGRAGVPIEPERISLDINGLRVLAHGVPQAISDEDGRRALAPVEIQIDVHMGLGTETVTYWTCDLSHRYITINSAYRT